MSDDGKHAGTVIKVGGSLYDLPDLGVRLSNWLDTLDSKKVILIPGGGQIVDAVRHLDRLHQLGEERAHSLAIQALSLSAHCLAAIVPRGVVCPDLEQCSVRWREGSIPILDVHRFVVEDEQSCGALPHSWSTTSDSLAARVARVAGLKRLILLKSVTIPRELSWK